MTKEDSLEWRAITDAIKKHWADIVNDPNLKVPTVYAHGKMQGLLKKAQEIKRKYC